MIPCSRSVQVCRGPVAALILAVWAFAHAQPVTLAHGPGFTVSGADVLAESSRSIPPDSRVSVLSKPDNVQKMVSNLGVRRALAQEALRDGLDQDPVVTAALRAARDRVLSEARLARLDAENSPAENTLEAYAHSAYLANSKPGRFVAPAQTRASHILINNDGPTALEKAQEILAKLRAGANFSDVAKQESTDAPSAARGGDLGFFGPGKMVRPFEDAVNALKNPGDLSEPVLSQFGYHIIRLEERRPAGRRPYEEVRADLMREARQTIRNEARMQKAQSLIQKIEFDAAAIEAFAAKPGQ